MLLCAFSKLPQLGTIVATATADFDGDGWVDVLLVTNDTSSLQGTVVWGAASGLLSGDNRLLSDCVSLVLSFIICMQETVQLLGLGGQRHLF